MAELAGRTTPAPAFGEQDADLRGYTGGVGSVCGTVTDGGVYVVSMCEVVELFNASGKSKGLRHILIEERLPLGLAALNGFLESVHDNVPDIGL